MERWMLVYYPRDDQLVPGVADDDAARITMPTLVFRSGESDAWHTARDERGRRRRTARTARLVEPPWGDREWLERSAKHRTGEAPLFSGWPALAPPLLAWADEALG